MDEQKFERGTQITIFRSDRMEDLTALVLAFVIAIGILLVVGNR
jgi:hypothetical protein